MSRKSDTVARFIKPTSIQIGDYIRAESQVQDATIIKVGRVARRSQYQHSTEYETKDGIVLVTHWRENGQHEKVTLLDRPPNVVELPVEQETLF